MNAKVTGCGELTVVLSHGYGGSQSVWDKIVPILAKRHKVVVFDWNFSGAVEQPVAFDDLKYSSFSAFSDDLIALVDELGLEGSVFVGHSMAGMIGCIASVKRPDVFSQLVLIGSSPRYLNEEDYEGGFDQDEVDAILASIESNFETWAPSFASLVVGSNDPISVEKFGWSLRRMKPEVALSVARTVFLSDLREVLEDVQVPCTIIHCSKDVVVPNSVAQYMQSRIRGHASLEIIETTGHFPQLTAHEMLLDVLDRVLSSSNY